MSVTGKIFGKLKDTFHSLVHAHEVLSDISARIKLEAEKVSQEFRTSGARARQKIGLGTEFYEARPLQEDDDPSEKNARLSVQYRQPMVAKKQVETSHHVYMWICRKNRMSFISEYAKKQASALENKAGAQAFNKAQVSEILLLAMAKHLSRNNESVGLLDMPGVFRGRNASERLFQQLEDAEAEKSDMPAMDKRIPHNSTVILFSDFIMEPAVLNKELDRMVGLGLSGHLVMVLDPAEVTFEGYEGRMEFLDSDGASPPVLVEDAEEEKENIMKVMREHIASIRTIAEKNNFTLTVQRTDEPLHNALLSIYGLSPDGPLPEGTVPKQGPEI